MSFTRAMRLLLMAAAMLSLSTALAGQRRGSRNAMPSYVPGEVLVKFSSAASYRSTETNRLVGAETLERLGDTGIERVRLPQGLTVESAVAIYSTLGGVEYAQPNYYYRLLATPNDVQYNTPPGMYGMAAISAPSAWDLSTGSSSVVVANIDTGVRATHQDLAANLWVNTAEIPANGMDDDANGVVDDINGADFRDNDGNPADPHGHGTHTAGTVGAVGNNFLNVVGVNWNVRLMSIKIYNAGGLDTTSTMLINAYNYVRTMKLRGVNIVATNNSYGGCGEACGYDQLTKDALDAMGDAGIVNVFAAGNDSLDVDAQPVGNPSPGFPVRYNSPSIIGVASSTSSDTRSGFSNWGLSSIDLAAPGSAILSTWNSSDTSTVTIQGTSMATPHVTGAVALLAAYRPDLSPESLKASILNNVDPLANWTGLVKTGGRLNVFKAMQTPTICTFDTGGVAATRLRASRAQTIGIQVMAPVNCDYRVTSNASWLTVPANNSFSGNGTIPVTVSANNTGAARTAVISFGGRTFTVTQNGVGTTR